MASDAPRMVLYLSTGEAVSVPRATVARCGALLQIPEDSFTLPADAPVSAHTLHLLLELDALAIADAAEVHNAALSAVWLGGAEAGTAAARNAGGATGRVAAAVRERLLLPDGWRTEELAALLHAAEYLDDAATLRQVVDALCVATAGMDSGELRAALRLPDDLTAPGDMAAVRSAVQELLPLPAELRARWAASGAGVGMAALPEQVLCKLLGASQSHADFMAAALTCVAFANAAAEEARLGDDGEKVSSLFLTDVFAAMPPGDATSSHQCVRRHCRVLNSKRGGRNGERERERDGGALSVDDVVLLLRAAIALIASGRLLSSEQLSFLALTPAALSREAGVVSAAAFEALAAEVLAGSVASAAHADAAMQAAIASAPGDAMAVLHACVAACTPHATACAQAQLLLDALAGDNGAAGHTVWRTPACEATEAALRAAAAAATSGNEALATRVLAVLDPALDPATWLSASYQQPLGARLLCTARCSVRGRVMARPIAVLLPPAVLARCTSMLRRAAALAGETPTLRVPFDAPEPNCLDAVQTWCEYHAPGGPADSAREEEVKVWDSQFVQVDQGTLFEIILAANHLGIKDLSDLTCLTVANMIKGKSPEEIRRTFNIKNDFTPEEEEEVRRENQWAFE